MASLSRVPIVDVTNDNFKEIWPSLILAMSSSSFIALDTELSGLGHRKKLTAKQLEDRYSHIRGAAQTRSILSLGISCFKAMGSSDSQTTSNQVAWSYIVQTFNILILCEEDYVVEPASLQFLVHHGFDFNKQYEKGVPYYRGEDKETDKSYQSIRHLFTELVSMQIPIVLHNGLVDLLFLYENLYTSLPSSLAMFLADVADMFPAGIIDTKYITDFENRMQASYLEYVFRKCMKDNSQRKCGCSIHFPYYPDSFPHVSYRSCNYRDAYNIASNPQVYLDTVCVTYAAHGYCSKGKFCTKSHDINLIIDTDNYTAGQKSRKRKRRKERLEMRKSLNGSVNIDEEVDKDDSLEMEEDSVASENGTDCKTLKSDCSIVGESKPVLDLPSVDGTQQNGGHRSGYDAFMTGYIYAIYLSGEKQDQMKRIEEWKNKLYLSGKDYPLTIYKSAYAKHSKLHLDKISKIRNTIGIV